ncbi:hypothetical protein [Yoonia sp. BS5-3]|uniref:Uncharacterized protein n=1 Tax=Yoonia phaeophyticola TaxID=3137369 RepID=A0ABZ2V432_9RHOB
MRVQKLDVGLAEISRWQVEDEQHLPRDGALTRKFLPQIQALDQILRRPSLDERLPDMLEPEIVDQDLLDPSVMTEARLGALAVFDQAGNQASGQARQALQQVAAILSEEVALDRDIRTALAALFRG